MKITKRVVDAATPKAARAYLWDDELRGFGLVVQPTGVKSYVFNYRSPEGRLRRLLLGRHGDLTCEQARKLAAEHKHSVVHGGDPLRAKQAQRNAVTVGDLLDAYLASDEFNDKAQITKDIDRGRIERHLRPLLGKRHAHHLTEQDVRSAFRDIASGKTALDVKTRPRGRARVRGGPGAARMAIVLLSIIFNWAIRARMMKQNPCAHIKLPPVGTRDTILEDADDYSKLFKALDRLEAKLVIRREAADAIRLIALTGCRRGEAANLRWRHVERERIVLPPREHKSGKRTGKQKVISLPAAAQAIIARQSEGAPDDFVFAPARGEGGSISLSRVWTKVRREAGLPAALSLHGLRHSTASHMAMAGAEAPQIMVALGQSQLSTVQRYIHFAKNARSALAEQAAATALAGMAASQGKTAATVLKLKGGRK
jgi:integrase